MSDQSLTPRMRILLSFSSEYTNLARRLERDLSAANIDVVFDKWKGGGGVPARQCVANGVDDTACVLPLLTPSEAARTWVSEEWKRTIYDEARQRNIAILPVWGDGDLEAIPLFLRDVSAAAIGRKDYTHEVRRLIESIRDRSGDNRIKVAIDERDLARADALPALSENPLVLEVGKSLAARLKGDGSASFVDDRIPLMRDGLFYELGVRFPRLHLSVISSMAPWSAKILINDIPEDEAIVRPDSIVVNETVDAMVKRGISAKRVINPATGAEHAWIPVDRAAELDDAYLVTWDIHEFLTLWLSAVLRRKASDFIVMDEVEALLKYVESFRPRLVAETVPKTVSLFMLTDVLRRLVHEGVSIRNSRQILMALAQWGRIEQDPLMLTEYVRCALKRQITHVYSRGTHQLAVFLLHPDLESLIRNSSKHTATGSYLVLEPSEVQRIVNAIQKPVSRLPDGTQHPQIMTTLDIRASVRRLVAQSMPQIHAVSYDELEPDTDIQPIGRISLDGFDPRPGITVGGVELWT